MKVLKLEFFWVLTSCSFVVGFQRFGGLCYIHLHYEVTPCSVAEEYQRFEGPSYFNFTDFLECVLSKTGCSFPFSTLFIMYGGEKKQA